MKKQITSAFGDLSGLLTALADPQLYTSDYDDLLQLSHWAEEVHRNLMQYESNISNLEGNEAFPDLCDLLSDAESLAEAYMELGGLNRTVFIQGINERSLLIQSDLWGELDSKYDEVEEESPESNDVHYTSLLTRLANIDISELDVEVKTPEGYTVSAVTLHEIATRYLDNLWCIDPKADVYVNACLTELDRVSGESANNEDGEINTDTPLEMLQKGLLVVQYNQRRDDLRNKDLSQRQFYVADLDDKLEKLNKSGYKYDMDYFREVGVLLTNLEDYEPPVNETETTTNEDASKDIIAEIAGSLTELMKASESNATALCSGMSQRVYQGLEQRYQKITGSQLVGVITHSTHNNRRKLFETVGENLRNIKESDCWDTNLLMETDKMLTLLEQP